MGVGAQNRTHILFKKHEEQAQHTSGRRGENRETQIATVLLHAKVNQRGRGPKGSIDPRLTQAVRARTTDLTRGGPSLRSGVTQARMGTHTQNPCMHALAQAHTHVPPQPPAHECRSVPAFCLWGYFGRHHGRRGATMRGDNNSKREAAREG